MKGITLDSLQVSPIFLVKLSKFCGKFKTSQHKKSATNPSTVFDEHSAPSSNLHKSPAARVTQLINSKNMKCYKIDDMIHFITSFRSIKSILFMIYDFLTFFATSLHCGIVRFSLKDFFLGEGRKYRNKKKNIKKYKKNGNVGEKIN